MSFPQLSPAPAAALHIHCSVHITATPINTPGYKHLKKSTDIAFSRRKLNFTSDFLASYNLYPPSVSISKFRDANDLTAKNFLLQRGLTCFPTRHHCVQAKHLQTRNRRPKHPLHVLHTETDVLVPHTRPIPLNNYMLQQHDQLLNLFPPVPTQRSPSGSLAYSYSFLAATPTQC